MPAHPLSINFGARMHPARNPPLLQLGAGSRRCARGATLIEVLVSVVVSSIGLLGMACLQSLSIKANQFAYQSTQAGLAAQMLIDSMHTNFAAVANGGYNFASAAAIESGADCRTQGCSVMQRASDDRSRFDRMLLLSLPNAESSLSCESASSVIFGYRGLCRLQIDWSAQAPSVAKDSTRQSLVWIFEP